MMIRPIQGPEGLPYWYVLQTHAAAEVVFNRFWDLNRKSHVNKHGDLVRDRGLLKEKPNESEKFCRILNDATVWFKSGENFEDLRSETLGGAVIDEYRQQSPKLWPMVIRPMLARYNGWADILSTPNGFEHFSDLWTAAQSDAEWECIQAPSTEAPWWTEEEIASAKATMTEDEFAQEILAEFREFGRGKVYTKHSNLNQMIQNPFAITGQKWCPYLPLVLGADFNVGLMCWEIGQFKGDAGFFGEEIAIPNTDTPECSAEFVRRIKSHRAGVVIVGDASGKARKTSATETDYMIMLRVLRGAGFEVKNLTPEANPPVKDRVNVFNAALCDAGGTRHLWYNPLTCKKLGKDLQRVVWREGTVSAEIEKKKHPELTHASDAAGYPVYHFCNTFRTRPGRMHVIVRN